MKLDFAEKLAQVKTNLTWWANTHLTKFFGIWSHFQNLLEIGRKQQKNITLVQGGFHSIWLFPHTKTPKIVFFEIYPSPVGTDKLETNCIHLGMYSGNISSILWWYTHVQGGLDQI